MKKVCVISDNAKIYNAVRESLNDNDDYEIEWFFSEGNKEFIQEAGIKSGLHAVNLKNICTAWYMKYTVIISLHCKQIFPKRIVDSVRCVNVHPGMLPYNRGMYPQVFSIINGMPFGVTIHEMDEKIDSGRVIIQKKINILPDDTSDKVYARAIMTEVELLVENIHRIVQGDYKTEILDGVGNYNSRQDFCKLCCIDTNKKLTMREAIDYLRALTFEGYDNAYFVSENGKKVFVSVKLREE